MNETGQIEVPVIYSEVTYLEMVKDPHVQPADLGRFLMSVPGLPDKLGEDRPE